MIRMKKRRTEERKGGKMKKRKAEKRLLCLLLVGAATLAGCGGKDAAGNAHRDAGGGSGGAGGQTAMGRYVEEETDFSDRASVLKEICKRDDGSLVILDNNLGYFVSKDGGMTWESEMPGWMREMQEKSYYISETAMSPDGTVSVIYDGTPGDGDYIPGMDLILPDGTRVPAALEVEEEDRKIRSVEMTEDNRIFVNTYGPGIYEVFQDGSGRKVLEAQERPYWFRVKDNLIFMDNDYGNRGSVPLIYDMEAGEYIEDTVLVDFVEESYGERYYNGSDYASMYLLPGEGQTVYVIGKQGIHRHVIGGNLMEQIVDGKLSMLSNPSYQISGAVQLEGDEFIVLFANNRMLRFTYDPDVPAAPEKVLTVYSLQEDEDLRQAVSLYQAKHLDTFVSYEVGMEEGSSVTREDAVKKLNTEVAAGAGPDLIMLDGLPFSSYVSKGLLLDISDYLAQYSAQEPLFDNVTEALKVDGKAYVAPATFGVPRLAGEGNIVAGMTDLDDVAAGVEALREAHPGDDIIGMCSADTIMKRFALTSEPLWIMENGSLDREAIGVFLEQSKRIYDAQMDGIRAEIVQSYEEEENAGFYNSGPMRVDWDLANDIFDYIGGSSYLISGWLDTAYSYMESSSIDKIKGYEDSRIVPIQGECSGLFLPKTLLGISAASAQIEDAKEFLGFFLSAEVQANYYGLPVNQKAYDIQFVPNESWMGEDRAFGYLSLASEEGTVVEFTVYYPTEEQTAEFKQELASVNTAYLPDSVLEDAVFASGAAYIKGEQTLDGALSEIEKQVAIYMAE
ncbi:MAG: extracellular solute-binding protein [Blautia sp.]|nr:extracellular solute-binding protein [Blautia sp.]MCM1200827.1 extracellular solute-binding protein [Bacteroides fragilis]